MDYSKINVDQINQGSSPLAAGNPLTANLDGAYFDGPVVIGTNPTALPLATLNVGPPAPPILPSLTGLFKGLLTENKLGIFNGLGTGLFTGLKKALGIKLHTGIKQQTGLNSQTGAKLTTGLAFSGTLIYQPGHVLSNKKNLPFDMPHPNKAGWRLRHVCIEGPEIAVYCRGKVPPDGIINLPSFWDGLVNTQDMSINITPIGCWQELFVKEICQGKQVIVMNNAGSSINADYHIVARRLDDDLIVEYEGQSHEDYPGGNEGYTFSFEHNYVKNLIQETVKKTVLESMQEDN